MNNKRAIVLGLALCAGGVQAQSEPILWITDDVTKNLYRVDIQGQLLQAPFRPPVGATSGLAIDLVDGSFWAAREGPVGVGGLVNFSRLGVEIRTIARELFSVSALEGVATDVFDEDSLWAIDDPVDQAEQARVYQLTRAGSVIASFTRPLPANSPQAIAVDPVDGTLWVTDNTTETIYNVSATGELLASFPRTIYEPDAVTASPVGIAFEFDDSGSGGDSTVRDEFSVASFSNNDGSVNWAGDWVEDDPDGQSAGSGQIAIENGQLTLEDRPNSGQEPSARRRVNLAGATSATFSFDFATTVGVDSNDAITVDVSNNGGSSWTTLQVITGIFGVNSGSLSYDISAFATATTEVRFRVTNLYGGANEFFLVDNVQVAFDSRSPPPPPPPSSDVARDRFNSVSYANNDGSLNWSGNWQEQDEFGGSASTGQVAIENNELTLEDSPDTGTQPSIARQVDIAGAGDATFAFDFGTTAGVDSNDAVAAEVSNDGGASWTTLETFTGISGVNSGTRCYDISAFAASNTQVRYRVTNLYGGGNELFLVDNVEVSVDSGGC